jgi:hypothetical protein
MAISFGRAIEGCSNREGQPVSEGTAAIRRDYNVNGRSLFRDVAGGGSAVTALCGPSRGQPGPDPAGGHGASFRAIAALALPRSIMHDSSAADPYMVRRIRFQPTLAK